MASHVNTVRIQEHAVSIDNSYENASETDFEVDRGSQLPPKQVYIMSSRFILLRV